MADNSSDWSDVANTGSSNMTARMYATDAALQALHPEWPTGGTAAQIRQESNGNNNAVSSAGAIGIAQFEPSTFDAVKKQMGRPGMDIHNVNDQMDAHQYLMHQNLQRTGDVNQSLSLYNSGKPDANNPETKDYISKFAQRTGYNGPSAGNPSANGDAGWEDVGKPAASDGWEDVQKQPEQPGVMDNLGNWASGLGQAVAHVGSGMAGQAVGGLHSLADLATGHSDQATADIQRDTNALTYQPRTDEGKQLSGYADKAMDFIGNTVPEKLAPYLAQGIANQTGYDKPITPDDLDQMKTLQQGLMTLEMGRGMTMGPELLRAKQAALKGQVDQMDALNAAGAPEGPGTSSGGTPMGANEGPQRGAFTVDSSGNVDTGLPTDEATFWAQRADQMQKDAQAAQGAQMSPNDGPQLPGGMGANAGPQMPAAEMQARQAAQAAQMGPNAGPQFQPNAPVQTPFDKSQPDMFGGFPQDYAGPQAEPSQYIPDNVRQALGMPLNKDESPTGTRNLRQQQLDFSQRLGSDSPYNVDAAGNVKTGAPLTPDQQAMSATMAKSRAFGDHPNSGPQLPEGARESANRGPQIEPDVLQQRQQQMREMTGKQLDIFGDQDNAARPFDQRIGDSRNTLSDEHAEVPRSLSSDEFEETIQNLADKDGTRFQVPGFDDPARGPFMDAAYEHYTDMLHDDHGGLFDRPTIAKNFADAALKDSLERRVNEHPIVKANIKRVADAQSRVDNAGARAPQAAKDALTQAQNTLQKSVDNIGSHFKDAAKAVAPWEKDGIVYMNTFGDLSTMMKSIGAVLKGIHGLVFKTLDRVLPNVKNLDSDRQIFAQGIRDAINRQANREWPQTVNEQPKGQLKGIPGMRKALDAFDPYESQELSPAEIKSQMQQAKDIPSSAQNTVVNNILQGGQQLSSFYRNPIIKYVTEGVDRAVRDTKLFVKTQLSGKDGLRTKMQALNLDELTGIRSLMEMYEGQREFSPSELKHLGFNEKQADYYQKSIELEKNAFDKFNAGRAKAGLPPVDRRIAHIAGYFMGDFKRIVTDKDGKVVAVLAHNNRHSLETITKRFMEDHPNAENLTAEKIQLNKLKDETGAGDNRFHGYMEALNLLSGTNADVARVVQTYKDFMSKDAQAAMQNRSKFKSKDGIIGAEGRKSWQSAQKNATDGAKQQLRYLESLDKWSGMQEAISKSKEFLGDETIDKPNAKALANKYLDAVQGRNQGFMQHAVNGILNGVAQATGIGPSILKGMNNTTKSLVLMKFVGLFKLSHSAVTLVQPLQSIPALNQLLRSRGLDLPRLHGTSVTSIGRSLMSSFNMFAGQKLSPFEQGAKDFMAKNGTADVGMSNHFDNVTASSKFGEQAKHVAELNVSIPEQGARTFTMMYYSHMLKDLGLPEGEIYSTAHNLMRNAMVDYAPHERSMMFSKMGIMGDIASTLTRFKYNQISNHMVGAAEVNRGNGIAPLAHTIAASIALGGIRGVFAYEMADETMRGVTNVLAKMGVMKQPTSLDELTLSALHGIGSKYQGMKDAANWGAMSAMGVNMTGSLTNADSIPTDPLGSFIPGQGEVTTLAKAGWDVATHQNKQSLKGAAMALAPNSMKGMLEDALFTKNGKYTNPQTGLLEARRSTGDEVKRALSFRPLEESKNSFIARTAESKEEDISSLKHDILEKAKSDIMSNGGKPDPVQMQKWAGKYTGLGGDPSSFVSDMTAFMGKGQNLDRLQRQQGIPTGGSLSEVSRYNRTQELK